MNLTEVIDQIDEQSEGEKLSLGQIVDAFEDRGYGPLILALALIIVLPTGGIPGVPTVIAIAIILIASQLVLARPTPWLPEKIRKLDFNRSKFQKAATKIKPVTRKIDHVLKPRLAKFSAPTAARFIGLGCIILACFMPFLEVVPFADAVPSSAMVLLGLGLTARDGLVVLIGLVLAVLSAGGALYVLLF